MPGIRSLGEKTCAGETHHQGETDVNINQPLDLHEFYRKALPTIDNEELIDRLATYSRVVTRKKGEVIFQPEATGSSTIFLLDGIVKTYVIAPNGNECTYAFFYQPGFSISMTKERINLLDLCCKTVTPATYVELVGAGPYELAEEYPVLYRELLRGYMPFYFGMMSKLRAGYAMTAKERYLWFLGRYAPIVDKIPQVEIADFLGIKPQSLSRIKAELDEEQEQMKLEEQ